MEWLKSKLTHWHGASRLILLATLWTLLGPVQASGLATCSELETTLTARGNKLVADEHRNVVYCWSIFLDGFACSSEISFEIESRELDGNQQRRIRHQRRDAPSVSNNIVVTYQAWESCTATPEPQPITPITVPQPEPGQTEQNGMCVGNPIIPATGEKTLTQTDYEGSGAHPLNFVRQFKSRPNFTPPAPNSHAGLGSTWSHNHAVSLTQEGIVGSTNHIAKVQFGSASDTIFNWNATHGGWVNTYSTDTLTANAQGLLYTQKTDDSTWQFDTNGKLRTHTQRNGWTNTYSYSDASTPSTIAPQAGLLTSVTNQFGRTLHLSYNQASQLSSLTSPDGQTTRYTWDNTARLSSVNYADNTSKTYLYENDNWNQFITGLIDERSIRLATYTYDSQGRGISTEHAGGANRYTVNYGTPTTPTLVTDPLGTQRSYNYGTTLGKLAVTSATLPSGVGSNDAASRVQNASGLIDSETDFLGIQTLHTWDTHRRLALSTTTAAGRPEAQTSSTQWHPTWRLPVLITQPGRSTTYSYDLHGNKLTQSDTDTTSGQTRTWTWSYNAQSLPLTATDPRGGTTQYSYDTAANLSSLKNPLGQETRFTFDNAGQVLSQTQPSGLLTSYSYDRRGRLLQITRGTEITTLSYTPSGQLSRLMQPNGHTISYNYDAAQRWSSASDNRGHSVVYKLDALGNRVYEEVRDASGALAQLTTRVINHLNRLSAISGASGQSTLFGYDANGELLSQTDPLNQSTQQTLDALRRPINSTLPDNASTSQTWDTSNNLTQVSDPKGIITQYSRNIWGEITTETSPDIGKLTLERDAAGHIISSTDALGQTTHITRDTLGYPTQITLSDGTTQQLSYDSAGNLIQIMDTSGRTLYSYDPLGRILQKTQTVADNPAHPSTYSVSYQYHPGGQWAQITYPSGLKVYYRKNASGQINQIDVKAPGSLKPVTPFITDLSYTAFNQPTAWSWNRDSAKRSYDADGRMSSTEFSNYSYDSANRITSITQNLRVQKSTTHTLDILPVTWSASYDKRGRLISLNRTGASSQYSYDANSNRQTSVETSSSDLDLEGDLDPAYTQKTSKKTNLLDNTSNKLWGFSQTLSAVKQNKSIAQSANQVHYSVDAAGQLSSDGLRGFTYDATGRLSQTRLSRHEDAMQVNYLHNALGQRVFKSERRGKSKSESQDRQEQGDDFVNWLKQNLAWFYSQEPTHDQAQLGQSYVYDDSATPNLLGEYGNGGSQSTGAMEYIWLPTEGGPSIPVGIYQDGAFWAIHSDHLNTPRLITNAQRQVLWQWPYSAFGGNAPIGALKVLAKDKKDKSDETPTLKLQASAAQVTVNLRYPGQYFDVESNLNYNYLRSYRPTDGRYTQPDPIGLRGGLNPYSYVGGNPLSFVDPDGLVRKLGNPVDLMPLEGGGGGFGGGGAMRPSNFSPPNSGRGGAFNEAKRMNDIPTSQQPVATRPNTDLRGNLQPGRRYDYDIPSNGGSSRRVTLRDDAGGHIFGPNDSQNRGPHFNDMCGRHYDY